MVAKDRLIKLHGSERQAPQESRKLTDADSSEQIEITLRLRSKTSDAALDRVAQRLGKQRPKLRKYLTREELEAKHGAREADVHKVEAFAHENNLTIRRVHMSSRVVRLQGTVNDIRKAFSVDLRMAKFGDRTYRVRQGAVSVPKSLSGIVIGVHGIDNRPIAKPHVRRKNGASAHKRTQPRSLRVSEIAKLYDFPDDLTGKGQCVAVIELNGLDRAGRATDTGYDVADLKTFFAANGIAMPDIISVGVDGGGNLPGKPEGGDDEVTLDIEVAGAIAPGARYAVYFAPNTTNGFIDAVKAAVHDKQRKPSVVAISWGGTEDPKGNFSKQFLEGLDEAFRDAALLGVTVCVAAGDDGAADMSPNEWDGVAHVDFPASSPYALSCGGTRLIGSDGVIAQETVWNDGIEGGASGGGVSNFFLRPAYQANASVPASPKGKRGRGVPDVAGNADPETGYAIFLKGRNEVIGGTSAVAPLMAGLIALINEQLSKKTPKSAGFINELLYSPKGSSTFRDILSGDNDIYGKLGKYRAGIGWDACSGLGVANGTALMKFLTT